MTRASCRCGQTLTLPADGSDRVVCPRCGSRVRIRRAEGAGSPGAELRGDGYLRFFCPCGRRLKVNAEQPPSHGKCPDCGRIVPVPTSTAPAPSGPDSKTVDLTPADVAALDRWARNHTAQVTSAPAAPSTTELNDRPRAGAGRAEVGLRVCPGCGKPVHLGSDYCRSCGAAMPRR
jgi:hypothetical protein